MFWGGGTTKAIGRAAKVDLGFACVGGRREIGIYLDALKAEGRGPSRVPSVGVTGMRQLSPGFEVMERLTVQPGLD
ncbi:MAG: hypothetical protein WA836_18540 [Candidatus Binataceae bacterium]